MLTWARHLGVAVLAGGALVVSAGPASAQFRVLPSTGGYSAAPYYRMYNSTYGYNPYYSAGYRNPYWNPGFSSFNPYIFGGDPYGGYLNGSANVINAQGQYLINTQQAYLTKEQVRSAQIDNKRKAFDEYLYEKSKTPTLNEVRVKEQQEEFRRAMTNPPETEIWSGYSLNTVLQHIFTMHNSGVQGPEVPLNPNTLRQINLTVKGAGNVGLLKDDKLKWPIGLQIVQPKDETTELRKDIDTLMARGKAQAMSGDVDAGLVVQLEKDINKLRNNLVAQVANFEFSDYTQAKNYLRQLDQAVKILKQNDAQNYVNGKYEAKGQTVAQLVSYMQQSGLKFAPAQAGEEAAYSALFQALLQYDMGSTSMMAQSAPPPYPPK